MPQCSGDVQICLQRSGHDEPKSAVNPGPVDILMNQSSTSDDSDMQYHKGDLSSSRDSPASENAPQEREHWNSKWDYILSVAGSFIGLGNVWRFPYLCYRNGGGAFLIPYGFFLIFGGIPLFFLEQSLGQFTQLGGIEAWNLVPQWKGIGHASVVICFMLNTYFTVILTWCVYYFVSSLRDGLSISTPTEMKGTPFLWATCNNTWNSGCCFESIKTNSSSNATAIVVRDPLANCSHKIPPAVEFWEKNVLQASKSIDIGYNDMNWHLLACLVGCWIFIYFCLWKGVRSSGKVVWVTATAPFFLIMVFLIRALTLPNASIGIQRYLSIDSAKLLNIQCWLDAGTQIFWSFSICLSAHTSLGSYNKRSNNVYKQCVLLGLLNSTTSFISGFVVFGVLGFMAGEQGVTIDDVAKAGPGLAFVAYPKAITLMPGARIWGAVFFVMIFMLGIDSQFVCTEGVVTSICDIFDDFFNSKKGKERNAREKLVAGICIASFLLGLTMITKNGIFVFNLFDFYSASGMVLLIVAFFEFVAISYPVIGGYGAMRFWGNITDMMGYKPVGGTVMPAIWMSMGPLLCITTFVGYLFKFEPLTMTFDSRPDEIYRNPPWATAIGVMMTMSSVILIPGWLIYYRVWGYKTHRNPLAEVSEKLPY